MKKVICFAFSLLCLMAVAACAEDFSSSNFRPWPARAYRPPLVAGAIKVEAPAGALKSVDTLTSGTHYGANSRPIQVWASCQMVGGAKVWTIHRLGLCGNPSSGGWTVPCPKPVVLESRIYIRCQEQARPTTSTTTTTTTTTTTSSAQPLRVSKYGDVELPKWQQTGQWAINALVVSIPDEECQTKENKCTDTDKIGGDPTNGQMHN